MILEISFHARTSRLILVELGPSILCSGKQFCPCMGLFFTSSYLLYVDKIIRWRNRSERSPCMRKVGCSNPSRDRPKSLNRCWQHYCQTSGIRCEDHGSSEMTIINGYPCHSRCDTLQNPHSSIKGHKHNSKLQPFIGNGDVSNIVENSREGRKTPKQAKTITSNTCGESWYCWKQFSS